MKRSRPVKDTVTEAKNYIYRLLKIRFRSEREVRNKLRQKGFSEPTADEAVGYFKGVDLINDRLFTQKWITWRLAKPFGFKRIKLELREKGVAPELIEEQLSEAKSDYAEEETVARLAKRRAAKHSGVPREKVKQRVYGYLMRRGFNPAAVFKAIKNI